MAKILILRRDFEGAARWRFINDCRTVIEQCAELFARQPGLKQSDLAFLATEIHPLKKLEAIITQRLPPDHHYAPPERLACVHNLAAGTVVHERIRQSEEWIDYYATFASAVQPDDMTCFPKLDVRAAFTPDVYDNITRRQYPTHVHYAMMMSERVYGQIAERDAVLRLGHN